MSVEGIIAIVTSVLASGSAISAILTYVNGRKKIDIERAEMNVWIKEQLSYVRGTLDETKQEVKEFTGKQNKLNQQIARIEERINALEHRLTTIEEEIK